MLEEGEKLMTRVTSALFSRNTVTALMGASFPEKAAAVCDSEAGTVGAGGAVVVIIAAAAARYYCLLYTW